MTPNLDQTKRTLAEMAAASGFPLFGVTTPDYPPQARERFHAWHKAGFAADMTYLLRRRDLLSEEGLRGVRPDVARVILLGLPYAHPGECAAQGPRGQVSLFATGRDYHRVFESRSKPFLRFLAGQGDTPRAYVDHGPVMERLLAWRAGLGFIGKNGCLIHPDYGSFVFLGAILTTLPLTPDAPRPGDCGACTRCLRACPTGALREPFILDSRRCIAYHTVENKGEIPRELRPRMGRWILGCDLCQRVCPHNRALPVATLPDFQGTRLARRPALLPFFGYDDDAFRAQFAGNAAMRPGRRGMARNAAIAAGNYLRGTGRHDRAFATRLREVLEREEDPLLREALAWALETQAD